MRFNQYKHPDLCDLSTQDVWEEVMMQQHFESGQCLGGRFVLLRPIGRGGFSRVFLAGDLFDHGRRVVVKIFDPIAENANLTPNEIHQMCAREMRMLRQLQHPNMPRLISHDVYAKKPYIVMTLLLGQPLDQLLAEVRLAPRAAMNIFLQLCALVEYLHQQSPAILHLDLKPSNVLVDSNGVVSLIDFGTARTIDDFDDDGPMFGTHGYASPEIYAGQQLNPATDIYALGQILRDLADDSHLGEKLQPILRRSSECVQIYRYQRIADLEADVYSTVYRGCAVTPLAMLLIKIGSLLLTMIALVLLFQRLIGGC
jgi:serine/threonine-protein kinase